MLTTEEPAVPLRSVTSIRMPAMTGALERFRGALVAAAVVIVAIDSIGLGLDWAKSVDNAASSAAPHVHTRVTIPSPVVSASDNPAAAAGNNAAFSGSAGGAGSGTPIGPPVVSPTTGKTPAAPTSPAPPAPAVPLAQIDAAVPMLGLQASLGLGGGSCDAVNLTVIAVGDCQAPTGTGPVILHVGGSLLGG
jgi:hypothetical protein